VCQDTIVQNRTGAYPRISKRHSVFCFYFICFFKQLTAFLDPAYRKGLTLFIIKSTLMFAFLLSDTIKNFHQRQKTGKTTDILGLGHPKNFRYLVGTFFFISKREKSRCIKQVSFHLCTLSLLRSQRSLLTEPPLPRPRNASIGSAFTGTTLIPL